MIGVRFTRGTGNVAPRRCVVQGKVKRRDIIRKLRDAGLTFEEGGRHTIVYRDGVQVSAVPRHNEIAENTRRAIEKQTGVKLK